MAKTGAEHLKSLQDGREVYLNGKKVDDVTTHPAYRNAVAAASALYDFQAHPDHIDYMTFESPTSGERVNRCWQLTKSYEELVTRRKAVEGWSRLSGGWLGRSPDHIASSMVGQVMGLPVFEKHSPERAKALWNYFEWARDNAPGCDWVASFACDAPFAPADLVARLLEAVTSMDADMACAASGGRDHPVFALWPVRLAGALREAVVDRGVRKVDVWTGEYRLARAEYGTDPVDPFFNVNRPDDLAAAEALLAAA